MTGPLDGIQVLDLSQVVAGPLATQLLAEQGAEVIKVEPVGGELTRTTGPAHIRGLYANCNRGKRSLAIDLTVAEGTTIVRELADRSDLVVQNFRPGVVERLNLGYADVSPTNPEIIYLSVSGFGSSGPYSQRAVLDPVIQGITGMVTGQRSEALPFPDLVRTLVADKTTAYTAAQAVTAALFARERGHGGQHIEMSMLDATLAWFWPDGMADHTHLNPDIKAHRPPDLYQLVDTLDGQIVYFLATQNQFEGMWRAIGRDDLLADERYCKPIAMAGDFERAMEIAAAIRDGIGALTTDDAVARLADGSVPAGPVIEREAVFDDPQVLHNDLVVEWDHAVVGALRQAGPAGTFSATQPEFRAQIATAGEHNTEILTELGRSSEEIARLEAAGVIG